MQYQQWFNHDPPYTSTAGDVLRGIVDKSIHADYMLSLNLDFPFRILRFVPSKWFDNHKMRFFDFDLHFSPIMDLALYHRPAYDQTEVKFRPQDMLVSGGAELIVFPGIMRSLYLRASIAWNIVEWVNNPGGSYLPTWLPVIPKLPGGNGRELFIGMGHHY
jgi:hypothetical protein